MICARCLWRATVKTSPSPTINPINTTRLVDAARSSTGRDTVNFTTSAHRKHADKTISTSKAATSNLQRTPSAATSTSASQPFSASQSTNPEPTPTTPNPNAPSDPKAGPSSSPHEKQSHAAPAIVSSVPAGTVLKGLNYFKNKEDPVALEDHEYPSWLWTVLENPKKGKAIETSGQGEEERDPRLYSKSAKARRAANKRLRVAQASNPGAQVRKVPVYEQTVDLAADEGAVSGPIPGGYIGESAREELQKAMRAKRRQDIKTANFLKGMR